MQLFALIVLIYIFSWNFFDYLRINRKFENFNLFSKFGTKLEKKNIAKSKNLLFSINLSIIVSIFDKVFGCS